MASSLQALRTLGRTEAFERPADWKSATQQVGNLRYGVMPALESSDAASNLHNCSAKKSRTNRNEAFIFGSNMRTPCGRNNLSSKFSAPGPAQSAIYNL